jgi:hypothetical protein
MRVLNVILVCLVTSSDCVKRTLLMNEEFNFALQTPNFDKKVRNPIINEIFFSNGQSKEGIKVD